MTCRPLRRRRSATGGPARGGPTGERGARGDPRPDQARPAGPARPAPVRRDYRTADAPERRDARQLAQLLAERLVDYRATVRHCSTGDIAQTVADVLARRGVRRIVVAPALDPTWLPHSDIDAVGDDPPLSPHALDHVDGVLTTCAVAVAETGSLVLDTGAGQGRRMLTLVPDYLLVLVPSDAVVGTVPAAVARLEPTRPLTWISGPSATSDIDLNRVEGVHGPRTLDVVLAR
ncbi:MAG: LutC/YkgG family protein [Jiangellaceae bacterium]